MHRLQALDCAQEQALAACGQVGAFDEWHAQVTRQVGVLEIGFAERSRRQQHDARLRAVAQARPRRRPPAPERCRATAGRPTRCAARAARGRPPGTGARRSTGCAAHSPGPTVTACAERSPTSDHRHRAPRRRRRCAGACPRPAPRHAKGAGSRCAGIPVPAAAGPRATGAVHHRHRPACGRADALAARRLVRCRPSPARRRSAAAPRATTVVSPRSPPRRCLRADAPGCASRRPRESAAQSPSGAARRLPPDRRAARAHAPRSVATPAAACLRGRAVRPSGRPRPDRQLRRRTKPRQRDAKRAGWTRGGFSAGRAGHHVSRVASRACTGIPGSAAPPRPPSVLACDRSGRSAPGGGSPRYRR